MKKTADQLALEHSIRVREGELAVKEWADDFRIAIDFRDNDFYFAFKGALLAIDQAIETASDFGKQLSKLPKRRWVEILNLHLFPAYVLHQNQFEYFNGNSEEEHYANTKKYLMIDPKRVFIGEQCDKRIEREKFPNSEIFVLDRRKPKNERFYAV